MLATKIKYSPSVNIVRDSIYDFDYIATPNATGTFNTLLTDINTGTKAPPAYWCLWHRQIFFLISI